MPDGASAGRGRRKPRGAPRAAVAAGLLLAVSGSAAGSPPQDGRGAIAGRVEIQREVGSRARPSVRGLGGDRPEPSPDRRRSVVYLETAPRGAFEAGGPGRAVLDQRNETFVPHVLAVQAGTVVDFPNSDATYHNVFSLSKARRFDLGRYPQGRTKSVRFDEPGVIRVFCEIHSHMNAYVLVFAHRFFAVTDDAGGYRIDAVPPGRYRVAVWTDGEVRRTAPVEVAAGRVAALSFVVE